MFNVQMIGYLFHKWQLSLTKFSAPLWRESSGDHGF
jgi:hypothetical protein